MSTYQVEGVNVPAPGFPVAIMYWLFCGVESKYWNAMMLCELLTDCTRKLGYESVESGPSGIGLPYVTLLETKLTCWPFCENE